jgi:hypothetical protein
MVLGSELSLEEEHSWRCYLLDLRRKAGSVMALLTLAGWRRLLGLLVGHFWKTLDLL